jgi:Uma2 family endonuclease
VIVEVIDKWRARRTRAQRIRWYREYGVQECWLLDPRVQRVDVLDLRRSGVPHIYKPDDEFVSVVLQGFKMRVADLYGREL